MISKWEVVCFYFLVFRPLVCDKRSDLDWIFAKPDPIACVYNHFFFFSCIIEECCEMKDVASKIFKLLICELSLNSTLFNRRFLVNTRTLMMTNSVTVCKPKLIIVRFSSSRGCYVGDFVVFVIVDNLFGCSVSRFFCFFLNDVSFYHS